MPAAKDGEVQREMLLPQDVRAYIKEHNIDQAITAALNDVMRERPADPIGHLAGALAAKSASPPRLAALRADAAAPRAQLRFHVVVATRGVHARLHTFSLEGLLLAPEPPPEGEERRASATGAPELSVAEDAARLVKRRQEEEALVTFLEGFFRKAFKDAPVDDFLSFHERCEGLADAPAVEGFVVDAPRATAALADELLVAAARSLNTSRLEFLQQVLSRAGGTDLASPPLRAPADITAWRQRWPRVAMPIFFGGGPSPVKPPSLRVCTALSPFAGSAASESDSPSAGWFEAAVQSLRELGATAVRDLQKEKALAALAVEGRAHCPVGLERALELAQKGAEALAGAGRSAETCGVLIAAAEEAWLEEEGVYELEAGKKLPLEQLVDLYDGLAKTGWLRTVVQPFRQADVLAGCDLLRARRPELQLVVDLAGTEPQPAPKGAAYSCGLALEGSAPLWLKRYAALARTWREAGGCGRFLSLDAATAAAMPSALELALATAEAEVLCLPRDVAEADVARISARADDVLYGAMFPDDGA